MTVRARKKLMAACVGAAIAQWSAGPAFADSAVGVDTTLGNAANPAGGGNVPHVLLKEEGPDTVRRSPTGQLYGIPYDLSNETGVKAADGWQVHGSVELGAEAGAGLKNTVFRQYTDWKNGFLLNKFEVGGEKTDSAHFFDVFGGSAGRQDQFYGAQFGRYNDWKVKTFYNETLHVFSDNYKSLYNGVGTGNLTLPGNIVMPTPYIDGVAHTNGGTNGTVSVGGNTYTYVGAAAGACTATAPCWVYGNKVYGNGVSVAAINGVTGTANGTTGAITAGSAQSNQAATISSDLATVDTMELALVRKKGGARYDVNLSDTWKAYVSATNEQRVGARPFSMNYGSGNGTVQIAEPIDYSTTDFLAGLGYTDTLNAANLRFTGSLFHDRINEIKAQNPTFQVATAWGQVTQSTISTPPDNEAFNLKGEYARKLPDFFNGRFTAAAAYGTNRQNDALLTPLDPSVSLGNGFVAAGAGYPTTGVPFNVNNWNTPAALSRQTADQRLDTEMANLGLALKPVSDLTVNATARHYATLNKADDSLGHQYTAYNPLTGQYGYIRYNDSPSLVVAGTTPGGPCLAPNGAAVAGCTYNGPVAATLAGTAYPANNPTGIPVYSLGRSYRQETFALSANYDLSARRSLEGSVEREDFHRKFREREYTDEYKAKIGYVDRSFDKATVRASLEGDTKRGGDYNIGLLPGVAYYQQVAYGLALPGNSITNILNNAAAGLTGYGGVNPNNYLARFPVQMSRSDLANRDQGILNGRLNYMVLDDLDIGLTVQYRKIHYPDSFYGLEDDNQGTYNFDINWQPSASSQVTAYYSYQDTRRKQQGNPGGGSCTLAGFGNSVAALIAGCATTTTSTVAGAGMFPASSIWDMDTRDVNHVAGLNFQQDIGTTRLGIDYTFMSSRTQIGYNYGSTTFSTAQAAAEAALGNALPNMTTLQHTISTNLLIPITRKLSTRLMYRYEYFKVADWHYDGINTGVVQSLNSATETALMLNPGPTGYHVNVVGAFVQYKL